MLKENEEEKVKIKRRKVEVSKLKKAQSENIRVELKGKEYEFFIEETAEYERLVKFFVINGLEFDGDEEVDTEILNIYKLIDDKDNLIGGAVLAKREGKYIIDGIAVDEKYRKFHLGLALLNRIKKQVKSYGGHSIYLVARAPGFFRKNGFKEINHNKAPNFFECKSCSQYRVTCSPEIMKLDF